ncbi:MAG: hypothetical protein RR100_25580 [Comamonas sp.]
MTHTTILRTAFWVVLVGFIAWDYQHSKPVDLRLEAPLIAAGSGQAVQGGHCSMPD